MNEQSEQEIISQAMSLLAKRSTPATRAARTANAAKARAALDSPEGRQAKSDAAKARWAAIDPADRIARTEKMRASRAQNQQQKREANQGVAGNE